MKSIPVKMTEIKNEFLLFPDTRDKYVYLVDLGKESPGLDKIYHKEAYRIPGCTSQAWVVSKKDSENRFVFHTDSDAMIVKGLLYLLERLFNGHTQKEIDAVNGPKLIEDIGLGGTISSQRTNGFLGAIEKIKTELQT